MAETFASPVKSVGDFYKAILGKVVTIYFVLPAHERDPGLHRTGVVVDFAESAILLFEDGKVSWFNLDLIQSISPHSQ